MEEFFPGRGENLHDYLIPSAGDVPPVESILIEDPSPLGPFGAKGVGEPALIPTAPAPSPNKIHVLRSFQFTKRESVSAPMISAFLIEPLRIACAPIFKA